MSDVILFQQISRYCDLITMTVCVFEMIELFDFSGFLFKYYSSKIFIFSKNYCIVFCRGREVTPRQSRTGAARLIT